MGSVDQNIAAISEKLNQALATINKLAGDVDAELGPTAADLRSTLDGAKAALLDIQGAAGNLAALLSDGSPTIKDLRRALAEFSGAARSLKGLAQTLERQPESLLRGKRGD
jgi:paraquat-inducible protein B